MEGEDVPQKRYHHASVCLENNILVFGGVGLWQAEPLSYHIIWMFNMYTEQWSKHVIPESELAPTNILSECVVAIGNDVYMFGGFARKHKSSNALWTLKVTSSMRFEWREIITYNSMEAPSPRNSHTGREYAGHLWVFGGFGPGLFGYLNDSGERIGGWNNQPLSFDPSNQQWRNLRSYGAIPSPRAGHASTTGGHKAWFYGGNTTTVFDDLYELNMSSLIWTHILSGPPAPKGCYASALNNISGSKRVLHGGGDVNRVVNDTWILDIPSLTWKQYKSNTDHVRWYHSSPVGVNGCSVIIGGTMERQDRYDDYSTLFLIMLEPRSLQQLAIQMILKHRAELPLHNFPRKLIILFGISQSEENTPEGSSQTHTN